MLREFLFKKCTYFFPILAMAIGNWKKVAILETAEMGNCDPHVLVHFIGVAWRQSCFCCKCKFSYSICVHLFGVARIIRVRLKVCWVYLFLIFIFLVFMLFLGLASILFQLLSFVFFSVDAWIYSFTCIVLYIFLLLILIWVFTDLRFGKLSHLYLILKKLVCIFGKWDLIVFINFELGICDLFEVRLRSLLLLIKVIGKGLWSFIVAFLNYNFILFLSFFFAISNSELVRSKGVCLIGVQLLFFIVRVFLNILVILSGSSLVDITNLSLKHLVPSFIYLGWFLLFGCLALTSFMLGHHSPAIVLFLLVLLWLLGIYV